MIGKERMSLNLKKYFMIFVEIFTENSLLNVRRVSSSFNQSATLRMIFVKDTNIIKLIFFLNFYIYPTRRFF